MAGVLAFVAARGDAGRRRDEVAEALRILAHRGVDGTTVAAVPGGAAVLGGRPVSYPPSGAHAERYHIVLDGDILNAAQLRADLTTEHGAMFATTGDAEVVVAAYHHRGPNGIAALRGGYAFVLWDSRTRRAFGARDPWGIRPLYHLVTSEGLYLASEKKALLPFLEGVDGAGDGVDGANHVDGASQVDQACLAHYLTMQYVPETATLHRRVGRIGAGTSFAYTAGGPLADRRFASPRFRPVEPADPEALYESIRETVRESVHAAVRAAEPAGAFLSGGVDSAAIVALAREVQPDLPTFVVGYDVAGYSEIEQAEATAAALGVPLTSLVVGPAEVIAALPRVVWHLDDPIADPAVVAMYLLAGRVRSDVGVVLSGDGADELFGGYRMYREPVSLAMVSGLPEQMRRGLRAISRVVPQGVRGRSFLERGTTPVERRYDGGARVFTDEESALLLGTADVAVHTSDVTASAYAEAARLDDVTRMQVVDLYTRLRGDVLVKADRLTMAHGLVVRMPFLDPAVFEVAATIPTELRVPHRSHETKAALRRAFAEVVPEAVAGRPHASIRTPVGTWLRGELGEWADSVLAGSAAGDLLDLAHVRMLLAAHRAGEGEHARKVWTVLIFCLWYAIFVTGTLIP